VINLWPVQQAIFAALTAAPATYPVHDAVPQGAVYPYIVIGEISGLPDEELAAASADASFQVHAWSRSPGKKEAHAVLQFARARLDGQEVGAGAWACTEEFVEVLEDPASTAANRLYHGIARYRVRVS
jgi:hypothetical protein